MQEIHKYTSEREKPAVGQQCRADQSLYVRVMADTIGVCVLWVFPPCAPCDECC